MTVTEILLLIIGVVFFVASFFITEKLTPGELNKIGELSKADIHKIMEREVKNVSGELEKRVEEKAEEVMLRAERSMEKESNEKIMAISEYSDTVMESMNKTHNEIMFLYSMLNDKHTELTQFSSELQGVAGELHNKIEEENEKRIVQNTFAMETVQEEIDEQTFLQEEREALYVGSQPNGRSNTWNTAKDDNNHNDAILALHKEGKTGMEIAKKLGLGIGEVRLVINLYEGNKK
ncbi:MAG: hypothetical protein J6A92_01135 [Lachnospiraceae bacterium]|nr:hypothetical protein [Lachnospiraceae bacterium]